MPRDRASLTLEAVKAKLRGIVLAAEPEALIGSEESLVGEIGVSRSTLRQAARLLERQGLLRVSRGINGGYYGRRPDEKTIETAVSTYLGTLSLRYEDVTEVASLLWIEVLRRAASMNHAAARRVADHYRPRVLEPTPEATFHQVVEVEAAIREAIFKLIESRYIQLIFHINEAFARERFPLAAKSDNTPQQRQFVADWREAKLLELHCIAEGDVDLAVIAARNVRSLWHRRFWSKQPR